MKVLIMLTLTVVLCSSCTALPAEERAFAVALCVEKAEEWRVYARVPTYQTGGGYLTVSGEGATFAAALSNMDTAAPMRINLSQLRLLAADVALARTGELRSLLSALADRADMRMQCTVALTEMPAKDIADALKPATGTRLSKALDLMIDARIEQGIILPATLADVLCMGERQSPVVAALNVEEKEVGMSGGYTLDGKRFTVGEIALLSMLLGHAKDLQLSLPEGTAEVRDISARTELSEDFKTARVTLKLTAVSASCTEKGLDQALADAILPLLMKLSAAGCDALGFARQVIVRAGDMARWHRLNWPDMYRNIRWEVAVGVNGPV